MKVWVSKYVNILFVEFDTIIKKSQVRAMFKIVSSTYRYINKSALGGTYLGYWCFKIIMYIIMEFDFTTSGQSDTEECELFKQ